MFFDSVYGEWYLNSGIFVVFVALLVTFLDCGPGVCFSPTGDLMGAGLMMFYDGLNGEYCT